MSKKLETQLDCHACADKRSVTCQFKKPTFGQRALVSGTCDNCGSQMRYSVLLQGKQLSADPIEVKFSNEGKNLYNQRIAKQSTTP